MPKTTAALDRFWAKVNKTESCWLWTACSVAGGLDPDGIRYGQFWADGAMHRAHRWIYGQLVEPLIPGSAIDHLCRTTLCVRPSHLEQVTQQENTLRGIGPSAANAKRTHCVHGHPFDTTNTIIRSDGRRRCRKCNTRAA